MVCQNRHSYAVRVSHGAYTLYESRMGVGAILTRDARAQKGPGNFASGCRYRLYVICRQATVTTRATSGNQRSDHAVGRPRPICATFSNP